MESLRRTLELKNLKESSPSEYLIYSRREIRGNSGD